MAVALAPGLASAKVVAEPGLAQYCRQEALIKLGSNNAQVMMLPVEQTRGEFVAFGQTDEANPTLFECKFDKNRKFVSITMKPPAGQGGGASATNAAVDRCLGMMGPGSKAETVSPLKPGFFEVVMRNGNRRVACTASETGVGVEDWVEMKP
jgi:hypothetical protein